MRYTACLSRYATLHNTHQLSNTLTESCILLQSVVKSCVKNSTQIETCITCACWRHAQMRTQCKLSMRLITIHRRTPCIAWMALQSEACLYIFYHTGTTHCYTVQDDNNMKQNVYTIQKSSYQHPQHKDKRTTEFNLYAGFKLARHKHKPWNSGSLSHCFLYLLRYFAHAFLLTT